MSNEGSFDINEIMKDSPRYKITGKTWNVKGDLISWGCFWNPDERQWETHPLSEDDPVLHAIEIICKENDLEMENV